MDVRKVAVVFVILASLCLVACSDDTAAVEASSSVVSTSSSIASVSSAGSASSSSASTNPASSSSVASSSAFVSSSSVVTSSSAVASSSVVTSSSAVASSSAVVSSSAGPVAVGFTGFAANGASGTVTTTELTLTFDVEPVGLVIGDIAVTGATKVSLGGTGMSRTLTVSEITVNNGDSVTVTLANPAGYTISPSSKSTAVFIKTVAFTGLVANGSSGTVTTTGLTLTFDTDPVGLAIGDIAVTGATKGSLGGTGTSRTLTISGIAVTNGGHVSVVLASPSGYVIAPSSKTVGVCLNYREMVSVPGGTFEQRPTFGNTFMHTVTGFMLGKYELTYDLWYLVYQWAVVNGYQFAHAGREGAYAVDGAAPTAARYMPVTAISWRDAIVWCNAYSQMEGLTAVYCSDSMFQSPLTDSRDGSYADTINANDGSFDYPYVNWAASGYRLPTEGEWQYAASYRDGTSWTPCTYASGATADYNDATATGEVAWSIGNSGNYAMAVGAKAANALGMRDMSGNVLEWCWDWSVAAPSSAQTDYRGPGSGNAYIQRTFRGGSYGLAASSLAIGYRNGYFPYYTSYSVGMRLARRQ